MTESNFSTALKKLQKRPMYEGSGSLFFVVFSVMSVEDREREEEEEEEFDEDDDDEDDDLDDGLEFLDDDDEEEFEVLEGEGGKEKEGAALNGPKGKKKNGSHPPSLEKSNGRGRGGRGRGGGKGVGGERREKKKNGKGGRGGMGGRGEGRGGRGKGGRGEKGGIESKVIREERGIVCTFFVETGTCRFGDKCRYWHPNAHSPHLHAPPPSLLHSHSHSHSPAPAHSHSPAPAHSSPYSSSSTKDENCRLFAKGKCNYGENCKYSHSSPLAFQLDGQKSGKRVKERDHGELKGKNKREGKERKESTKGKRWERKRGEPGDGVASPSTPFLSAEVLRGLESGKFVKGVLRVNHVRRCEGFEFNFASLFVFSDF